MEVKAQLNGLRIAPRKVRLVTDLIKAKDVDAALNQLAHLAKRSARPVMKVLNSAVANAENNHRMVRSNLYVKSVSVDEGIKLRRWQPKGFGRAAPIQKKTSRVTILLDERVAGMRAAEQPKQPEPTPGAAEATPSTEGQEAKPGAPKQQAQAREQLAPKQAKGLTGRIRKMFRRKSI
jgi:large subunit ribosomal protein L22